MADGRRWAWGIVGCCVRAVVRLIAFYVMPTVTGVLLMAGFVVFQTCGPRVVMTLLCVAANYTVGSTTALQLLDAVLRLPLGLACVLLMVGKCTYGLLAAGGEGLVHVGPVLVVGVFTIPAACFLIWLKRLSRPMRGAERGEKGPVAIHTGGNPSSGMTGTSFGFRKKDERRRERGQVWKLLLLSFWRWQRMVFMPFLWSWASVEVFSAWMPPAHRVGFAWMGHAVLCAWCVMCLSCPLPRKAVKMLPISRRNYATMLWLEIVVAPVVVCMLTGAGTVLMFGDMVKYADTRAEGVAMLAKFPLVLLAAFAFSGLAASAAILYGRLNRLESARRALANFAALVAFIALTFMAFKTLLAWDALGGLQGAYLIAGLAGVAFSFRHREELVDVRLSAGCRGVLNTEIGWEGGGLRGLLSPIAAPLEKGADERRARSGDSIYRNPLAAGAVVGGLLVWMYFLTPQEAPSDDSVFGIFLTCVAAILPAGLGIGLAEFFPVRVYRALPRPSAWVAFHVAKAPFLCHAGMLGVLLAALAISPVVPVWNVLACGVGSLGLMLLTTAGVLAPRPWVLTAFTVALALHLEQLAWLYGQGVLVRLVPEAVVTAASLVFVAIGVGALYSVLTRRGEPYRRRPTMEWSRGR